MTPAGTPRRLELEITETALLHDDDAVLGALHKLRALGVRIALDDFGVGYSSLSHVTSFPFDRIKIDRSFVQKMKISESSRSVVCTILQLAERLKVSTTGEGVETSEQVEALRDEGCTEAQGFYFGRPQSAATLHLTSPGAALRLVAAAWARARRPALRAIGFRGGRQGTGPQVDSDAAGRR